MKLEAAIIGYERKDSKQQYMWFFSSSSPPDILSEPHPLYKASACTKIRFHPLFIQCTQLQAIIHFIKDLSCGGGGNETAGWSCCIKAQVTRGE